MTQSEAYIQGADDIVPLKDDILEPTTIFHLGTDAFASMLSFLADGDWLAFALTCTEFRNVANADKPRRSMAEHGIPISSCLVSVARLKWALQSLSVPWLRKKNSAVCARAAAVGNLDVLQCLREELDYPWGELTCAEAAAHGHLEVMRALPIFPLP